MIFPVINSVFGDTPPPIIWIAGVTVDVKVWEIATTNIEANPMVHRKQVVGWLKRNLYPIYLPRFHQLRCLPPLPITRTEDTFGYWKGVTRWIIGTWWIKVYQFHKKIGVGRI